MPENSEMKHAVVLLSGGIDSATTLAMAKSEGLDIYALSFNYEQRHSVELESARKIAAAYGAKKHLTININLREIGGSALTDDIEVPKNSSEVNKLASAEGEKSESHSIPVTYVPARNTIFLSFALAWAEILKAGKIFIGVNAIDYSGYPDCRPEFIKAFEDMANLATKASVEDRVSFSICAPLIKMTKAEIVRKGMELGIDYSLTWSCYDPVAVPEGAVKPCMKCDSCRLRARGFEEAGLKDPLILKANK